MTPKGLYTRALIIIIAPIVILRSILTFVFLDRHWRGVTGRLSGATAHEIAMLAAEYDWARDKGPAGLDRLSDLAREHLGLSVRFMPGEELPLTRSKPFYSVMDRPLSEEIRGHIRRPFWIDTVGSSAHIEIRVKLDGAVMRVLAPRAQLLPSNTHIFLVWMIVSSTILLVVAILFLRNQIPADPIACRRRRTGSAGAGPRHPISRSGGRARCGSPRKLSSKCATGSSVMSNSERSCSRASATT